MWQKNYNKGKLSLDKNYTDLGWQKHSGNSDEIKKCHDLNHSHREFDNSTYLNRCSDVIYICDKCKIYWHVDMSD
jgi:hypothetical protein